MTSKRLDTNITVIVIVHTNANIPISCYMTTTNKRLDANLIAIAIAYCNAMAITSNINLITTSNIEAKEECS